MRRRGGAEAGTKPRMDTSFPAGWCLFGARRAGELRPSNTDHMRKSFMNAHLIAVFHRHCVE